MHANSENQKRKFLVYWITIKFNGSKEKPKQAMDINRCGLCNYGINKSFVIVIFAGIHNLIEYQVSSVRDWEREVLQWFELLSPIFHAQNYVQDYPWIHAITPHSLYLLVFISRIIKKGDIICFEHYLIQNEFAIILYQHILLM